MGVSIRTSASFARRSQCGMPKRTSNMTELTAVRPSKEMTEEIAEWRATLRPMPSKGEAIRLLVREALDLQRRKASEARAEEGKKPR